MSNPNGPFDPPTHTVEGVGPVLMTQYGGPFDVRAHYTVTVKCGSYIDPIHVVAARGWAFGSFRVAFCPRCGDALPQEVVGGG